MTKKEMAKTIGTRRRAAYAVLRPQWRRCFWTRPFGHIRDGRTARDLHGGSDFSKVCVYCGKPSYLPYDEIERQEYHASLVGRYPIAKAVPKATQSA